MSKYLEVKICFDCPFNKSIFNGNDWCQLKNELLPNAIEVQNKKFPDWCPLKTKEELL